MLVLARRTGEYIMIGKDIMVKVAENDGNQLKLAIEAPKSINIVRGEVYEDKSKYRPDENI